MDESRRSLWLVDGYNVLRVSLSRTGASTEVDPRSSDGHTPDELAERIEEWWSAERRDFLISLARRLGRDPNIDIRVVFDNARLTRSTEEPSAVVSKEPTAVVSKEPSAVGPKEPSAVVSKEPLVRSVFAPSADDWIVAAVRARTSRSGSEATRTIVVTADRKLASRSRHHGAELVSNRRFLELCSCSGVRSA